MKNKEIFLVQDLIKEIRSCLFEHLDTVESIHKRNFKQEDIYDFLEKKVNEHLQQFKLDFALSEIERYKKEQIQLFLNKITTEQVEDDKNTKLKNEKVPICSQKKMLNFLKKHKLKTIILAFILLSGIISMFIDGDGNKTPNDDYYGDVLDDKKEKSQPSKGQDHQYNQYMENANNAIKQNDYSKAKKELNKALQVKPSSEKAQKQLEKTEKKISILNAKKGDSEKEKEKVLSSKEEKEKKNTDANTKIENNKESDQNSEDDTTKDSDTNISNNENKEEQSLLDKATDFFAQDDEESNADKEPSKIIEKTEDGPKETEQSNIDNPKKDISKDKKVEEQKEKSKKESSKTSEDQPISFWQKIKNFFVGLVETFKGLFD